MSGRDAKRKAWNEAMRSTAGAAALPPALQARMTARRSDRRKQARREKARKITVLDDDEYRCAVWMDALEGVDPSLGHMEEEEEYDELEEETTASRSSRGKRKSTVGKTAKKAGVMPKRFKPRSFASILVEEAARPDGVARAFLDAEATLDEKNREPARKFCPVTGQLAIYTDPKSMISYATLQALEQIRERAPPWLTLSGTAAYYEAVKSIKE